MSNALQTFFAVLPRKKLASVQSLGDAPNSTSNLYLTAASLTFPGVTVFAGALLNFLMDNFAGARIWVALGIAVVAGVFIVILDFTDPASDTTNSARGIAIGIGIGVANTLALWMSIFGVASVDVTGSAT